MLNNKLELTWYGKEKEVKVEPRLLIEDKSKSFTSDVPGQQSLLSSPTKDNLLIHGDNLLALKALESRFIGKIKCIYIDPPYNTGNAFSTYDDNLQHSIWLGLMKPRLEILRSLLSDDGSIWISIDDDEQAYLKVLCDEIFGRQNFVCNVIWEKKYSPQNDAKWLSDSHDFILLYAKNKEVWRPNPLARTEEMNKRYKNPDNDPRGPWKTTDFSARTYSPNGDFEITTPSGRVVRPPESRAWATNYEGYLRLLKDNRLWFGKKGDSIPQKKTFLSEVKQGSVSKTIWTRNEVGDNQDAKKEILALFPKNPFPTPKPEKLIQRILTLATKEEDWVLDSFLGSGTTAAVAQKMNRHWIGVEMTDVAYSIDKIRLDKVILGTDKGGITQAVKYNGGGGYHFYEIAPTLINIDSFGQPVINKAYSPEMLSAAVALHEGFKYEPDQNCFWKQAHNGSNSFLFVTTNHVNAQMVDTIRTELKDGEFLLISCRSFDSQLYGLYKNIVIKKIPQSLLKDCEYGKDNYDLNIVCPPEYEEDEDDE